MRIHSRSIFMCVLLQEKNRKVTEQILCCKNTGEKVSETTFHCDLWPAHFCVGLRSITWQTVHRPSAQHSYSDMAAPSRGPTYKVVLLGELGVGKTSLFRRLKDNTFDEYQTATTGIDSCTKVVKVDGETVMVRWCWNWACLIFLSTALLRFVLWIYAEEIEEGSLDHFTWTWLFQMYYYHWENSGTTG